MKIRSLLALVGLAISLAVPALAQQKHTPDPQLREALEALGKREDEAYNNNDAAAIAATFTEDAVFVTPQGPIFGSGAIEEYYADRLQKVHFSKHIIKFDADSPHVIGTAGNEMWATAEWSATYQVKGGDPVQLKGYWSAINVREGDGWKIRMLTYNVSPASAATASPSSQ